MSRISPAVWSRKEGRHLPQSINLLLQRVHHSCLRSKRADCAVRTCSKTSSVAPPGFTKSVKWHDCDRAALLLVVPPEVGTTCWTALTNPCPRRNHRWRQTLPRTEFVPRHETLNSRWCAAMLAAEPSLLDQNIEQRCCDKKGAGQKTREMGPGATWTRLGTQNFLRNTVRTCSALGPRQETQQHVAQGQQSEAEYQGMFLVVIFRTKRPQYEPHTAQSTDTTLPPCSARAPTTCRAPWVLAERANAP